MTCSIIWDALDIEIEYQRKRWDFRQPDGNFLGETHTIPEYILYANKYLIDSLSAAASQAGDVPALDILREVIYLAIACLRQAGTSMDYIKATPPAGNGNLCDFLIAIKGALICAESAARSTPANDSGCYRAAVIEWLRQVVGLGLGCFQALGIDSRDLSQPIINERDGLPA